VLNTSFFTDRARSVLLEVMVTVLGQ